MLDTAKDRAAMAWPMDGTTYQRIRLADTDDDGLTDSF
jgi:hypothetical protein